MPRYEAAERTLAKPRPQIEPPVEDKLAKWKREANEQAARIAAARAAEQPLTEYEAQKLEHRLAGLVGEQKELLLGVLAHALAGMRDELIEYLEAKLAAQLDQVRAENAINNKSGDIIELPTLPLKRKTG